MLVIQIIVCVSFSFFGRVIYYKHEKDPFIWVTDAGQNKKLRHWLKKDNMTHMVKIPSIFIRGVNFEHLTF